MKNTPRLMILLTIVALVLGLAACGGGGGGDGGEDETAIAFENFQAASLVLGQATFTAATANAGRGAGDVDSDGLATPFGNPVVAGGRLYLPDSGNNRILGFDDLPFINGTAADFALGQADLISNGTGTGSGELAAPETVHAADGQLFAADTGNNRVLIWTPLPSTTGAAAGIVVGQAGFGFNASATTDSGLNGPQSCLAVNGKLIVADTDNHRVLIWNSIPAGSGTAADLVLGQEDFTNGQANDDDQNGIQDGQPSARTLNRPTDIWSDGSQLLVADQANHRVLIWNSFPTVNFQPADLVLGQPDMTSAAAGTSASELAFPTALTSNGQMLFVADRNNNRVLIWNSLPSVDFVGADRVLGQGDFTHNTANDADQDGTTDGQPSARTLNAPSGLAWTPGQLIVTDAGNHRVLFFDGS
jgi:hypothetical protein